MSKQLSKKNVLLSGLFLVIMVTSAAVTGFISAKRDGVGATDNHSNFVNVSIFDDMVTPDTISVKVGETVMINNKSSVAKELSLGAGDASHGNVTQDDHEVNMHEYHESHEHISGFTSGVFDVDEAWKVTFSEPGTFFLHDHSNPKLNILVVVYKK